MQIFDPISDKETMNALIGNFRDALMKIVPNLEEVGIKWKDYFENEAVETIVESIYEALVVAKLNFLLGDNDTMKVIAGYGMFYKNYLKHNFVRVIDKSNPEKLYAFSYFTSQNSAFDSVCCNEVNQSRKVENEVIFKYDDVEFLI
jgi:hypothetical protein